MTDYKGIDYSLGRSNYNPETGIHFGVISQNAINLDCTSDFEMDYGQPHCPECGNPVLESDSDELPDDAEWNDGKDYACPECEECFWSDRCFPEEAIGWTYEQDGYTLTDCLDTDIFVLKSPYYTFAQYCSPCVPGAGNLESPCEDGPKTYCLGPEWFDKYSPMPYKCFRVTDNQEVTE